ncbi:hypothetical protein EC991_002787 [Linnemannia zychae]|nr:hypothetical protein EC991_002787 [Linnemannia zychae]
MTSAQPAPASSMGFISIDESALIVHGGHIRRIPYQDFDTNQMFSLDLTRSWTTASPAWYDLRPTNSPTKAWHSLSLSPNKDKLYLWDSLVGFIFYSYDISSATWSTIGAQNPQAYKSNALRSVVDPQSGKIYVPSGYGNGSQMLENIPASTGTDAPMPTDLVMPLAYYAFIWSTQLSGALLYGGHTNGGSTPNPVLRLFSNRNWTTLKTTGTSPGDVSAHCMVPAYNGTKIVVFGGSNILEVASSKIFILDVATLTWTAGTPADPQYARCDRDRTVLDGIPLIYNMKDDRWVTQYTPYVAPNAVNSTGTHSGLLPIPTGTGPTTPPAPSEPPAPPGPNVGAIAGGAAGAVVVGLLVGFFFYRRRKLASFNKEKSVLSNQDTLLLTTTTPNSRRSEIESQSPSDEHWSPKPPPSSPFVTGQHDYMGMEPLGASKADKNSAGIEVKMPYGDDDNHSPRNPQEYHPTHTESRISRNPQYHPRSSSEISPDYTLFLPEPNNPQDDGTTSAITRSNVGYGRSSIVDAERLKQELAQMEEQSRELEQKRKENQERLRQLLEEEEEEQDIPETVQ